MVHYRFYYDSKKLAGKYSLHSFHGLVNKFYDTRPTLVGLTLAWIVISLINKKYCTGRNYFLNLEASSNKNIAILTWLNLTNFTFCLSPGPTLCKKPLNGVGGSSGIGVLVFSMLFS